MKTLSKFFAIGLIMSLFPFYGMAETVAEVLEATTQVASSTSATHDEGVVINGIRWATRNVDAPGTFAENPEDAGMFFQWNRRKGWSATTPEVGITIDGWDSGFPRGRSWERENDPCPPGWRVPTSRELQSLLDTDNVWATKNEVNGRLFGIYSNQIFLPATGGRSGPYGNLHGIGERASYWSSTQRGRIGARMLNVSAYFVVANWIWRPNALPIRCVAK